MSNQNPTGPSFWVIATCDTKGIEGAYVRDHFLASGEPAILLDASASERGGERGPAVDATAAELARFVEQEFQAGRVLGVLALGGSAGTSIGCTVMRALPLGLPKVMVSTLAAGPTEHYVQGHDIEMVDAVADLAGLNRLTRQVLESAVEKTLGRAGRPSLKPASGPEAEQHRSQVAATMFGVTTPGVQSAKAVLEELGCEVVVFHATGTGGNTMESMIREGAFDGVLDLTTTELADELVGGVLSAGPTRLTAAGECGVPQVVSVGALDMVNFLGPESVPASFSGRKFHAHNAHVTLMRTTLDENSELGSRLAQRLLAGDLER
ncbi:MAG: Tm-1-like ATP-binding domain-containing protein, partial [Planctomycetes bacterium]|nr:Tm-1-like ATP-binding domain-containing protein [Planctomycetota bacterium]